jgi:hypothetical protein
VGRRAAVPRGVPVVVGAGERLFDGVANVELEPLGTGSDALVTHLTYRVRR